MIFLSLDEKIVWQRGRKPAGLPLETRGGGGAALRREQPKRERARALTEMKAVVARCKPCSCWAPRIPLRCSRPAGNAMHMCIYKLGKKGDRGKPGRSFTFTISARPLLFAGLLNADINDTHSETAHKLRKTTSFRFSGWKIDEINVFWIPRPIPLGTWRLFFATYSIYDPFLRTGSNVYVSYQQSAREPCFEISLNFVCSRR